MDLRHSSARHSNVHVQIASIPTFPLRFSFDCFCGPHASSALPPTMISPVDAWIPKYAPPSHMEASFPSGLPLLHTISSASTIPCTFAFHPFEVFLCCQYAATDLEPRQPESCVLYYPRPYGVYKSDFPSPSLHNLSILFRSVPEMVVALSTMPSSFKLPTGLF